MTCSNGNEYHDGTADDFGCKIQGIQFSGSGAAASGGKLTGAPRTPSNSWERGIVRNSRNMPLLVNKNGTLIECGVKEYANNRGKYETARKRLANS